MTHKVYEALIDGEPPNRRSGQPQEAFWDGYISERDGVQGRKYQVHSTAWWANKAGCDRAKRGDELTVPDFGCGSSDSGTGDSNG